MSYRCVIVDDEPIAHDILLNYIRQLDSLSVQKQFYNISDAADYFKDEHIDILFLDIKMPGMDGITFLKSLEVKPITIMTTAYREFAAEGFDLGVLDYLVKPIKAERFGLAVQRAMDFFELQKKNEKLIESEELAKSKSFTIKSGTKLISLPIDSVTHIQGLKDYAIIFAGKNKYVIKGYIKSVEAMLPKGQFTRVHKSFIVANSQIKILNRNRIEFDVFQIPVGRMYKQVVESVLAS